MRKKMIVVASLLLLTSCNYTPEPDVINEFDAEINVQEYVKNSLKSPSTAEFGICDVVDIGVDEFKVSGVVDAQNGFGAMIRSNYSAVIKFTDNGAKYVVSEFVLQ